MTFIQKLSQAITQRNEVPLQETMVVLPNKRARKMLQEELSNALRQPCFSPAILSIDEFIHQLSDYQLGNKIELLSILFRCHNSFEHAKGENLSQFLSWAETFLHDISEIDMQMADASQIFSNIADIKDLETSFGKEKISANQQRYLEFYKSLYELYTRFNDALAESKTAYEGRIYRDAAENIQQYAPKFNFKRYIFAGFQTLSPTEMEIMAYFHEKHDAEFYFDIDNLYKEDYTPFIRILQKKLNLRELHWIEDDYANTDKEITVVGASKSISQIQYAIEQLNRIEKEEGTLSNTVLVFADESLITPFIHCYDCQKANLTMGYPLTATPAYSLLSSLLATARNGLRFQSLQQQDKFPYYHRDVMSFYRNPLVINNIFGNRTEHEKHIQNLIGTNSIFFQRETLGYGDFEFPNLSGNCGEVFLNIIHFFEFLAEIKKKKQESDIDSYCLGLLIDNLRQSLHYLESFPTDIDLDSAIFILNSLILGVSIPLKGCPSEGLQIMGLLETRTLDFKNVIILSVNEGILPAGKSSNSLILFDVKRHFGLPTYQEKDSVYGYHFLRLLQRAEQVFILYNTDSSTSLAEKSRFIKQLEFEIKRRKLNNIKFQEIVLTNAASTGQTNGSIIIGKDDGIIAQLLQKKYSYSQLNDYLNCPLQFYLKDVAHIEAAEDISENIEQKIIGDAIHHILDDAGQEVIRKRSDYKSIFSKIINHIDEVAENAMRHAILQDRHATEQDHVSIDLDHGKLYLATEIVKKSVKTYLTALTIEMDEFQKSGHAFEIRHTELKMEGTVKVQGHDITLTGIADRIDYRNGHITLLDYKTGYVDDKGLQYTEFEDIFQGTAHKQLLQLLMYGYLYRQQSQKADGFPEPTPPPYACGIISFQRLFQKKQYELYPAFIYQDSEADKNLMSEEVILLFESHLKQLLADIINPEIPFQQTKDDTHCNYCDYRDICHKQAKADD